MQKHPPQAILPSRELQALHPKAALQVVPLVLDYPLALSLLEVMVLAEMVAEMVLVVVAAAADLVRASAARVAGRV